MESRMPPIQEEEEDEDTKVLDALKDVHFMMESHQDIHVKIEFCFKSGSPSTSRFCWGCSLYGWKAKDIIFPMPLTP